ncbi:MAG: hypothetical protein ABH885_08150, partial [Candidatus Omnitrophota bacterium]
GPDFILDMRTGKVYMDCELILSPNRAYWAARVSDGKGSQNIIGNIKGLTLDFKASEWRKVTESVRILRDDGRMHARYESIRGSVTDIIAADMSAGGKILALSLSDKHEFDVKAEGKTPFKTEKIIYGEDGVSITAFKRITAGGEGGWVGAHPLFNDPENPAFSWIRFSDGTMVVQRLKPADAENAGRQRHHGPRTVIDTDNEDIRRLLDLVPEGDRNYLWLYLGDPETKFTHMREWFSHPARVVFYRRDLSEAGADANSVFYSHMFSGKTADIFFPIQCSTDRRFIFAETDIESKTSRLHGNLDGLPRGDIVNEKVKRHDMGIMGWLILPGWTEPSNRGNEAAVSVKQRDGEGRIFNRIYLPSGKTWEKGRAMLDNYQEKGYMSKGSYYFVTGDGRALIDTGNKEMDENLCGKDIDGYISETGIPGNFVYCVKERGKADFIFAAENDNLILPGFDPRKPWFAERMAIKRSGISFVPEWALMGWVTEGDVLQRARSQYSWHWTLQNNAALYAELYGQHELECETLRKQRIFINNVFPQNGYLPKFPENADNSAYFSINEFRDNASALERTVPNGTRSFYPCVWDAYDLMFGEYPVSADNSSEYMDRLVAMAAGGEAEAVYRYPRLLIPFLERLLIKDRALIDNVKISPQVISLLEFSGKSAEEIERDFRVIWRAIHAGVFESNISVSGEYETRGAAELSAHLGRIPPGVALRVMTDGLAFCHDLPDVAGHLPDSARDILREGIETGFRGEVSEKTYAILSPHLFSDMFFERSIRDGVKRILREFIPEAELDIFMKYHALVGRMRLIVRDINGLTITTMDARIMRDAFAVSNNLDCRLLPVNSNFLYEDGDSDRLRPGCVDRALWGKYISMHKKYIRKERYDMPELARDSREADVMGFLTYHCFHMPGSLFWNAIMAGAAPASVREMYKVWLMELALRGIPQENKNDTVLDQLNILNQEMSMHRIELVRSWSLGFWPVLMAQIKEEAVRMMPGGKPYELTVVTDDEPLLRPLNRLLKRQHENYATLAGDDGNYRAVDARLETVKKNLTRKCKGQPAWDELKTMDMADQAGKTLGNYNREFGLSCQDFDVYSGYGSRGRVMASALWRERGGAGIDENNVRDSEYLDVNEAVNVSMGFMSGSMRAKITELGARYALPAPELFYRLVDDFREKYGQDYLDFDFQKEEYSRTERWLNPVLKHYRSVRWVVSRDDTVRRDEIWRAHEKLNADLNLA